MDDKINIDDFVSAYLNDELVEFGGESYAVERLDLENDFLDVFAKGTENPVGSVLAGKTMRATLVSEIPGKAIELEARRDVRGQWRLSEGVAISPVSML